MKKQEGLSEAEITQKTSNANCEAQMPTEGKGTTRFHAGGGIITLLTMENA